MTYFPHDLVRIHLGDLTLPHDCPAWVLPSLRKHPWAVVRRVQASDPACLPIGIRGSHRSQRYPASVPANVILERLTPEMLTTRIAESMRMRPEMALAVLPEIKHLLRDYRWGPVGSVGFFLATGADCVSDASDLDVVLRCEQVLELPAATVLVRALDALAPRTDLLLETPAGAVVLKEYVSSSGSFVLRTSDGPKLMESLA